MAVDLRKNRKRGIRALSLEWHLVDHTVPPKSPFTTGKSQEQVLPLMCMVDVKDLTGVKREKILNRIPTDHGRALSRLGTNRWIRLAKSENVKSEADLS